MISDDLPLFPDIPRRSKVRKPSGGGLPEVTPDEQQKVVAEYLAAPEDYNTGYAEGIVAIIKDPLPPEMSELIHLLGMEPVDVIQFMPLSAVLRGTREIKKITLEKAAKALKTPLRNIVHLETMLAAAVPPHIAPLYAEWLGIRDWYERWLAVNPEMGDFCASYEELYGLQSEAEKMTDGASAPKEVWQMKVALRGLKPVVWRRFLISNRATLEDLHDTLQVVMGWTNSHLHAFNLPGFKPDFDDDTGQRQRKLERAQLHTLGLKLKSKFRYQYDFGDGWEHDVVLEKIRPAEKDETLPWCLEGKNACPPEDSGGVWGYADKLEIIRDPKHPDHEVIREWMGADFDPEEFDANQVNTWLHPKKKKLKPKS